MFTLYKASRISLKCSGLSPAGFTPFTSRPKLVNFDGSAEAGRGIGESSMAMVVGILEHLFPRPSGNNFHDLMITI